MDPSHPNHPDHPDRKKRDEVTDLCEAATKVSQGIG